MININKKIEEIRQKPEHERLRYVWGAVALSMLLVLLVWILSVKISFQKSRDAAPSQTLPDISQQLQDVKDAAPSLGDIGKIMTDNPSGQPSADVQAGANPAVSPAQ